MDQDPRGPKTCGSGSATLIFADVQKLEVGSRSGSAPKRCLSTTLHTGIQYIQRSNVSNCILELRITGAQCSGSVAFWFRSGSRTLDLRVRIRLLILLFLLGTQDANKNIFFLVYFAYYRTFCGFIYDQSSKM